MTSHMGHTLPSDDSSFEDLMDRLDADGLEVRPEERAKLAAAHQFGLLAGILPVIHRAMDMGALSPSDAAGYRRLVRDIGEDGERPAKHRATFRAPECHVHEDRDWVIAADGSTFFHTACGQTWPGGIDRADTSDKAAAHHNECEAVRDV